MKTIVSRLEKLNKLESEIGMNRKYCGSYVYHVTRNWTDIFTITRIRRITEIVEYRISLAQTLEILDNLITAAKETIESMKIAFKGEGITYYENI